MKAAKSVFREMQTQGQGGIGQTLGMRGWKSEGSISKSLRGRATEEGGERGILGPKARGCLEAVRGCFPAEA